jgi:hypothetical protein
MSDGKTRIPVVACAGLLLSLTGCGGSNATTHTGAGPSNASANAVATWASRTQQLCREKRAAIARLGYVHITYAGIARVGLPTVKRSLEGYLGRLMALLRDFSRRQRQVATPPSVASTMRMATEADAQSQAATSRLRRAVMNAKTAVELSAAFRGWIATLRGLAARGDALAQQLNLPDCRSGSAASSR